MHRGKQVRGIVAGTQKQAAAAIGSGIGYIREYWSRTGNETELAVALAQPGVLFYTTNQNRTVANDYKPVEQVA